LVERSGRGMAAKKKKKKRGQEIEKDFALVCPAGVKVEDD
jgi:hypothetical protein